MLLKRKKRKKVDSVSRLRLKTHPEKSPWGLTARWRFPSTSQTVGSRQKKKKNGHHTQSGGPPFSVSFLLLLLLFFFDSLLSSSSLFVCPFIHFFPLSFTPTFRALNFISILFAGSFGS
jgi:hypothetical protein